MAEVAFQLWQLLSQIAPAADPVALGTGIAQAADLVRQADRTVICGTGKSRFVADRLAANLRLIGCQSYSFSAADLPHGDYGMFGAGSIGIFVSASGCDPHIVAAARRVCTEFLISGIAITNAINADISRICDITISCGDETDLFGAWPPIFNFHRLSVMGDLILETLMRQDLSSRSAQATRNHQ